MCHSVSMRKLTLLVTCEKYRTYLSSSQLATAAQLSMKDALPLAKSLATASRRIDYSWRCHTPLRIISRTRIALVRQGMEMTQIESATGRCRYSTVNFLQNIHKRHPTARPSGRGMGCIFWVQPLIDTVSRSCIARARPAVPLGIMRHSID